MTTPTIAVALHDGFYGCGTGAGHANRVFLDILTRLVRDDVRLVILPVWLDPTSPEHNPDWHTDTRKLLRHKRTEIHPVDNGTHGQRRFGGLAQFRRLAVTTAHTLTQHVLPTSRPRLVVAFDVPFLGLPPLLPPDVLRDVVLVPRSTAVLHAPSDRERVAWESYGMHTNITHGGKIAAISTHMRRHLTDQYWIPDEALIDLTDGLGPTDWELPHPEDLILPVAAHAGFLLSMGRAMPYKGFDDLLDALVLLRDTGFTVPHLVLAAVTDDPQPNPYQNHLGDRIADEHINATLLTRFSPALRGLFAHPALRAVVVPSRAEPFGRIPLEAYAAGACPVISTTAGGLAEHIDHQRTGFATPPDNPTALSEAIRTALTRTVHPGIVDQMRCRATEFARTRDYSVSVRHFLSDVAPWLRLRSVDQSA
ncbi:glycosyltransferase family 4 protein [Nocardia terpenica]|uniref:glycosyltransferase family 4 protein n=1 Tax=Nocardia terpenica TaxID=455432 RepID=UPI002FE01E94